MNDSVPTDPRIGTVLSERYRIDNLLGEGGMGRVYAAEHVMMKKRLAVKILRRELTSVPEVVARVQEVRKQGMGVISMKLCGEGTFDREDRRKAMRFAFQNAGVDCVTVGYKAPAEVDEAIENLNLALA